MKNMKTLVKEFWAAQPQPVGLDKNGFAVVWSEETRLQKIQEIQTHVEAICNRAEKYIMTRLGKRIVCRKIESIITKKYPQLGIHLFFC